MIRFSMLLVSVPSIYVAACVPMELIGVGAESDRSVYSAQLEAGTPLAMFGNDNPTCQLWTDWQQVCSRTGPSGSTVCVSSAVDVPASEPFCEAASNMNFREISSERTVAQRASRNRFCEEFGDGVNFSSDTCIRWSTERPFNALRLDEMEHSWCKVWKANVDADVNPELSAQMGYYCALREVPDWCATAGGMGLGPQIDASRQASPQVIIPVQVNPAGTPVNFTYCAKRNANAQS